jgi:hypothetical protein
MRLIGRLILGFLALVFGAAIAAAIAAAYLKSRLTSRGIPNDDEIELVAIFEGHDFTSTAQSLRRVDLTAIYGGGTLDLRLATLDPSGATLSVRTVFGGFRVAVPGTWQVEIRNVGLFGGIIDSRRREWLDSNGPRLTIEGFAAFGGLAVVSETPDFGPARPTALDDDDGEAPRNEPPGDNRGLVTDIEQALPAPADV